MSLPRFAALMLIGALAVPFTAGAIAEDVMADPAIAAMTPAEMVAARIAGMKQNGGLMRQAGGLTGTAATDAADVMIQNYANFKELFPEGSNVGDSKALPAIWASTENYNEFIGWFDDGLAAAQAMKTAALANDADAYGAALKSIGATCGTCHTKYRAE